MINFRNGFYAGLLAAIVLGLYLYRLWQPERQIRLHSQHLVQAIEAKSWRKLESFIDGAYEDQWGHDRVVLLNRLRGVLGYARNLRIEQQNVTVRETDDAMEWSALIRLDADENEISTLIKERVNVLEAPFVLRWRNTSGKPWDWKLVRATNESLVLPAGINY